MKIIASVESDVGSLLKLLKQEAIPAEVKTTTQESGLVMSEIIVQDSDYDRGCDVAEKWMAAQNDEAEKRSGRHCPKCGSYHLTFVPLEDDMPSYKCRDCGYEFLPPVHWRT